MGYLKCSNESCGHIFESSVNRCPFCGEPVTDKCEKVKKSNNTDEFDGNFWSLLWKFLHFYEQLNPSKAYLLLGGEAIAGIGFCLWGWLTSSNSGYRGNATGAGGFVIGGILLFYSLYAIIKHTTKQFMTKKDPHVKEIKIRAIALLAELIAGGVLFILGKSISDNRDVSEMLGIIGVGIATVAILSMLKFLIKMLFNKR